MFIKATMANMNKNMISVTKCILKNEKKNGYQVQLIEFTYMQAYRRSYDPGGSPPLCTVSDKQW